MYSGFLALLVLMSMLLMMVLVPVLGAVLGTSGGCICAPASPFLAMVGSKVNLVASRWLESCLGLRARSLLVLLVMDALLLDVSVLLQVD